MILNHLDLYVPDVVATRDFFLRHFDFRHDRTLGADALAVMHDDAGMELVISKPVAKRGGADQVTLGTTTYHIGFHLPSTARVDEVFWGLRDHDDPHVDPRE